MKKLVALGSASLLLTASFGVAAKVSQAEADRLGKDLTPVGAEKAGNSDGSIPSWEGGVEAPSSYSKGQRYVNPYASDSPTVTITASNMGKFDALLSEGHKKLLKTHASYKMNVYPSRRSAKYPQAIYDATKANATTAVLEGSDGLKNAKLGFPFPIPGAGAEVIVNHKVRYRGDNVIRANDQAIIYPNGKIGITKVTEEALFTYGNLKKPGNIAKDNMILFYLGEITAPPKSAGKFTLVHETADQVKTPRKAWIANKGQPRPRRAPNVSYDNPSDGTDGMQFNEQVDVYNGALDRYTWKLHGKKEMITPYNSYDMGKAEYKYKDLLPAKHPNQDVPRYEKHRLWVVEGNVKPGISHQFSKRMIYVDEDCWCITMVDLYDKRGQLWRFQEGHVLAAYDVPAIGASPELIFDFNSGVYFATALTNEGDLNKYNQKSIAKKKYFTTSSLKRKLK